MASADPPRLHWSTRKDQPLPRPALLHPPEQEGPARLLRGDNLTALACLTRDPKVCGQVTLAYLDPPFLTGREHFHTKRSKDPREGEGSPERTWAFDDRFPTLNAYLDVLEPRLRLLRELLAPHGSLVLHVDPKTSHYAKIICDEIFGPDAFASEVIWRYRRWPSKTKNFQRVHDVMLRYVKDPEAEPRFNQLYEPLAASTIATWGTKKQRAVTNESGRRLRSSKTREETPGTPMGDVWEISIVAPVAKERTGYPTQKPEALLGRWIEALSDPGDLILDPYVGSGTTMIAALNRGRRVIGIDLGETAHEVTRARLSAAGYAWQEQEVVARLRRTPTDSARKDEIASSAATRTAAAPWSKTG